MKLFTLLLPTFLYLAESQITSNLQGCATPEQIASTTDFFPDKLYPSNAKTFNITYYDTYKVLTNFGANQSYLLYQCGTDPPQAEIDSGKYRAITPIPLPDGVALTSTVQIPMFELLGERSSIKTYIGDSIYISSPCLLEDIDAGEVDIHPQNEINQQTSSGLWVLNWEAEHPDRIIIDNNFMTSAGQGTTHTIIENGYLEGPPKATYEWLIYYSYMFNKEAMAKDIIAESDERYDCTVANAKNSLNPGQPKPTAVWGYFSDYPGYEGWNVAGCTDQPDEYQCTYTKDCQIELLHNEDRLSDEEFLEFAKDADIFFFSSDNWETRYPDKKEILDQLKSVKNEQVYDFERSGNFTWWEQRMAEYDAVLEDICVVANRTTDLNPHTRLYARNVFTEARGLAPLDSCDDPEAPMQSRATECTRLAVQSTENGASAPDSSANSLKSSAWALSLFAIGVAASLG